jgi:ribokinase
MNETEAAILAGRPASDIDLRYPSNLAAVMHYFLSKGVKSVVITLGSNGVAYQTFECANYKHIPAKAITVVDSTAAGDTFVGAYAVAWVLSGMHDHGTSIDFAVSRANEAASLAVQREGAQSSIPWLDEISGGMQRF